MRIGDARGHSVGSTAPWPRKDPETTFSGEFAMPSMIPLKAFRSCGFEGSSPKSAACLPSFFPNCPSAMRSPPFAASGCQGCSLFASSLWRHRNSIPFTAGARNISNVLREVREILRVVRVGV